MPAKVRTIGRELLKKAHLVPALPYKIAKEYSLFIFKLKKGTAHIATTAPAQPILKILPKLLRKKTVIYATTPAILHQALEAGYSPVHGYRALSELRERHPEESAYQVLYAWQKYFSITLGGVLLALAFFDLRNVVWQLFLFANIFYFIYNPVKLYISLRGFSGLRRAVSVSAREVQHLRDTQLPKYTIFVPLYQESAVLPQIIANINKLDYPKNKLDVKIIMEARDQETIRAAQRLGLNRLPYIDEVIVPEADIKTKPRACNYALYRARGEYCVIFDAEDDPDPDQLKKALVAFRKLNDDFVCLQGRLSYYNPEENLLTSWFTLEYSYWFDFYLEGLDSVRAPLPLGGTSNHFKTKELRKLGGWDPYNVTEDADLGVRIAARQKRTAMIHSYTYEEANAKLGNWIRQRSRWQKGYMQTYLVHMRHPLNLLKKLSWPQFWFFQFSFGGNILLPLINPLLWTLTILTLLLPRQFQFLHQPGLITLSIFNLVVGNLLYIWCHLLTAVLRRNSRLVLPALFVPIYWLLISIGAWKGAWQLITKPFYWEKTKHGLSRFKRPAFAGFKE